MLADVISTGFFLGCLLRPFMSSFSTGGFAAMMASVVTGEV
jgi:hypothetical protein